MSARARTHTHTHTRTPSSLSRSSTPTPNTANIPIHNILFISHGMIEYIYRVELSTRRSNDIVDCEINIRIGIYINGGRLEAEEGGIR